VRRQALVVVLHVAFGECAIEVTDHLQFTLRRVNGDEIDRREREGARDGGRNTRPAAINLARFSAKRLGLPMYTSHLVRDGPAGAAAVAVAVAAGAAFVSTLIPSSHRAARQVRGRGARAAQQ
jgi:hypothetical protein